MVVDLLLRHTKPNARLFVKAIRLHSESQFCHSKLDRRVQISLFISTGKQQMCLSSTEDTLQLVLISDSIDATRVSELRTSILIVFPQLKIRIQPLHRLGDITHGIRYLTIVVFQTQETIISRLLQEQMSQLNRKGGVIVMMPQKAATQVTHLIARDYKELADLISSKGSATQKGKSVNTIVTAKSPLTSSVSVSGKGPVVLRGSKFNVAQQNPLIQVVIRQSPKLDLISNEFQQSTYGISRFSTPQDLKHLAVHFSDTTPTVVISDESLAGIELHFKKFKNFHVLVIQKTRSSSPIKIRSQDKNQPANEDPKVISDQLKTHIAKIISTGTKPTPMLRNFDTLVKQSLRDCVFVDEFMKPRFFSPNCFYKVRNLSIANVIVIQQEDFAEIQNQTSPNDRVIVLVREGQLIKGDLMKAELTTKNPQAISGYIRKLYNQARGETHVLYDYEIDNLQEQIHQKLKGKFIQLKYHDEQSLMKKINGCVEKALVVVITPKYLKMSKIILDTNRGIEIILFEPYHKCQSYDKVKTVKTMPDLIRQFQMLVTKH